MKVESYIAQLCNEIVRDFRPQKVILFGSYASKTQTFDSDIDLLVIMPYEGNELDKMAEVRGRLSSKMPLDVLVKTPAQIEQRLQMGDFFVREIMETGKVLYDAGDLGVGA